MKFIDKYLIEFDFPYNDILQSNKKIILDYYYSQKNSNTKTFDLTIRDQSFIDYFSPKIKEIVEDSFFIEDKTKENISFAVVVQDNKNNFPVYHNHVNNPNGLCGVFYTNIPKEGGEFEIINPPLFPIEKPLRLKPQINKLYLFPYWLYHRPLPQKDTEPRICFNIGYFSSSKVIVKRHGYLW